MVHDRAVPPGSIVEWTMWYDDGSVFRSSDGAPNDSPKNGCVLVTQVFRDRLESLSGGSSWFVHRVDEGWLNCDREGMQDQLIHFSPLVDCVRLGRWMDRVEWKALVGRAAIDLRGK